MITVENEKWKDVVGFEGFYQVSNHGRLKSFKGDKAGRILSNKNRTGWYLNVVLQVGGRGSNRWSVKMHSLVALHFLGPKPSCGHNINHIDGNKQNNRADNLEWVTQRENMLHAAITNPEFLSGMKRHNQHLRPKGIIQFSLDGRFIDLFSNAKDASLATGVCSRNICQVADGTEYKPGMKRKQAGGFVWKRVVELSSEGRC